MGTNQFIIKTSCAGGRHNIPRPLQVDNIFLFIRQVAGLFRHVGYLRHLQQVDLWHFDLESGVQVTCDMGYLCANFSLPGLLSVSEMTYTVSSGTLNSSIPYHTIPYLGFSVLDLDPMYASDRSQTSDVRRASSLNVPAY